MVKILNVVAALFVLLGIIGFFVSYHDVSDLKKDSEFWEQSASEN
ncbi:hypothetical protein GCM10010912_22140 [Paenibacillus albidus]|uniref:Uncharacterized protein n=1 Tax=Paenibacillus albidus TaxID=2041023 RepID=A0A917C7U8_9BACL|nr:hypothetical protein [Paenibacillus albidus]GGF76603.1 hypothetical protein GCM10010912_22140 [Paenibacillus albidus]